MGASVFLLVEAFQQPKMGAPLPEHGRLAINSGKTGATAPGEAEDGYISCMARTVAIVEDDPAIRANYADMLKKHGYQVSAFGDRGSALAAFRSRLPDLAPLDIGLPRRPDGGFLLCRG